MFGIGSNRSKYGKVYETEIFSNYNGTTRMEKGYKSKRFYRVVLADLSFALCITFSGLCKDKDSFPFTFVLLSGIR